MSVLNSRLPARLREMTSNFGDLMYPSGGGTHGVVMIFHEYAYRKGAISSVEQKGSIYLPMPDKLSEDIMLRVGSNEIGIMGAAAAELSSGNTAAVDSYLSAVAASGAMASDAVGAMQEGSGSTLSSIATTGRDYANYMTRAGLGSLSPDVAAGLGAAAGTAVNPHATLIFEGVAPRQYSMAWKFAPSSVKETDDVAKIIRLIKSRILPSYKSGSAENSVSRGLLTYPHLVNLYIKGMNSNHVTKYKTAMISQFQVDYSPNGHVMQKGDQGSSPAFVNLTMNFTEADIWTAEDFEG